MKINKLYIALGVLALLLATSGVRGDMSVSPKEREVCCGITAYDVLLSNEDSGFQRAFHLSAESLDSEDIWVSLEPETVVVQGGRTQELSMFARPECGLEPGEYRIILRYGQYDESGEETVILRVPEGCEAPEENGAPQEVEGPSGEEGGEMPETAAEEHGGDEQGPAGGAVTGADDSIIIAAVIILAIILAALLALALRESK